MKRLIAVLLVSCSFFAQSGKAEDVFPKFQTSPIMTIYLPMQLIDGYEPDSMHESGLNVKYELKNVQLFTDSNTRHIQTLSEGFSGRTDRSTPWKTLTELTAAYQTGNIEAVRSLFTPESQSEIDQILADTAIKQKYIDWMQSIKSVDVLLGFEYRDGFLAMIESRYKEMAPTENVAPTPLFFVKSDEKYLLSATTLDEPIDSNIALFLQQGHSVSDLLNPPLPEYTLSLEKTGSGSGFVDGSGMECGDDCLEVYQEGMVVFLKAYPDEGSTFEGWLLEGQPINGRLEMQKDITVIAIFNQVANF